MKVEPSGQTVFGGHASCQWAGLSGKALLSFLSCGSSESWHLICPLESKTILFHEGLNLGLPLEWKQEADESAHSVWKMCPVLLHSAITGCCQFPASVLTSSLELISQHALLSLVPFFFPGEKPEALLGQSSSRPSRETKSHSFPLLAAVLQQPCLISQPDGCMSRFYLALL